MKFPKCLEKRNRKNIQEKFLLFFNYMFARHKPYSQWLPEDEYPDFSQIRTNQSFNWSVFSTPIWTRFNNQRQYLKDHGVIGYKVKTIRNTSKYDPQFDDDTFLLKHKPDENNYSHCELYLNKKITHSQKRKIRITFKNECIKSYKPLENPPKKRKIIFGYILMYFHRLIFNTVVLFKNFRLNKTRTIKIND